MLSRIQETERIGACHMPCLIKIEASISLKQFFPRCVCCNRQRSDNNEEHNYTRIKERRQNAFLLYAVPDKNC